MDKSKWEYKPFEDCIEKSKKTKQLMTSDYQPEGSYPIISQEASLISGYTDDADYVNHYDRPIIVFGDHTRVLKYVDFDFAVGADGVKILIPNATLNAKFLLNYLTWYKIPNLGYSRHYKLLKDISIPIPPISDQQRIVAELDCLNEMIALKQEQLKEFDKLAQSIFYDMFGDPMDNIHVWEISVLQDVVSENCSISYGIVQPGDDVENGVPVVRPVDLVNQVVYKDGLKIVDKAISDSYKRTILRGDELLFCVRGTTGIISFASEELEGCNVTRGITPLEFGDRIDRYYAYYLLNTPYLQSIIAEKTNGIALKQINMRDVRLLPIMCPPLALQQQFAEKIQAIEAQKELVKQSIAETQHLFDSRMDYYFD